MNIKDAYKHPKFYQKVDKTTGFRTRYEKEREGIFILTCVALGTFFVYQSVTTQEVSN